MNGNITLTTPEALKEIIKEVVNDALRSFVQLGTSNDIGDEFLTRKEACEFLRIGATKFNELRQDGIVKPIRIGKKTIYKKSELLEIFELIKSNSLEESKIKS